MKFRRTVITAAAMSAAASLTFAVAAQADPGLIQSIDKDQRGDVRVVDKEAPDLDVAKLLADARLSDFGISEVDGKTFRASFQIQRLVSAKDSMRQIVYVYYTDGRTKNVAGDIMIHVNNKTATIIPRDTAREFCHVDAVTNRKQKSVTFEVDSACFAVDSARFKPMVLVEHGDNSDRAGDDIAYDRMDMTSLFTFNK